MILTAGSPSSPALVFLHGLMGDKEDWRPIMAELEDHYFCIALDLPGHGENLTAQSISNWQQVLSFIQQKLDLLERSYHIVGYSLGGRLAMGLACDFPDQVLSLQLISSHPGLPSEEKPARLRSDKQLFDQVSSEEELSAFLERWYQAPLFQGLDATALIQKRRHGPYQQWARALHFLSAGAQPSYWVKLQQAKFPISYYCGQKDQKYLQVGTRLSELGSLYSWEVFENCSHAPHLQRPALFMAKLLNSLNFSA